MTIKEFEKKLNEVNMPANALFRPHLHVKQADKAGLDFSGIVRREIYKNQVSVFLDMPDEETLLFTITPPHKDIMFWSINSNTDILTMDETTLEWYANVLKITSNFIKKLKKANS